MGSSLGIVMQQDKNTSASTPSDWHTLRTLWPYLWQFPRRVLIALGLLLFAKLANVAVPLVFKYIVDALDSKNAVVVFPALLLIGYGLLRLISSAFGEFRDVVFAKVAQRAIRNVALQVFNHLHALSLRFHLERQTGGISRDIERGTRGIGFLLSFMLFNILPTLLEIGLVTLVLVAKYHYSFALVTLITLTLYIGYTLWATERRMLVRRAMNEMDSRANSHAIDSLLNYETVKYFGNESYEATRYDGVLEKWEDAALKNQMGLSTLNVGQSAIIAIGTTALMAVATRGVVNGTMTLGDLVLVNAYMLQLYMPLNFLGFVYREIKQSLADMGRMFSLLGNHPEIKDVANARKLEANGGCIGFHNVDFSYEPRRQILRGISFEVPAGRTVAIVGASGAGKSTISRLLYRFYEVDRGSITINGHDIRLVKQQSLREVIGIVPQDTVLFNDTILYNIRYGLPSASIEEAIEVAKSAHIHEFISALPDGYETLVGERGLKLSGGEKQRVAIARMLLKNPKILIFDEATSALDSHSEKAIQSELTRIAKGKTTLVIAHRLSTVVDADHILVMNHGEIVERGNHHELLQQNGQYAKMWALQLCE
jgi:ATP-binding cassette, subfamily B, heavy metal transporter